MLIKINLSDIRIILEAIFDEKLAAKFVSAKNACIDNDVHDSGRAAIDVSCNEAEVIIDMLSDYLVNSGIDSNGELNPLGYRLEALIDIFNDA